jgi:hypothetical protein
MKKFSDTLLKIEPTLYKFLKSIIGDDIWIFPCMWLKPLLANANCNRNHIEKIWDIFFVTSLDYLLCVALSFLNLRASAILALESYNVPEYLKTMPSTITEKELNYIIIHSLQLYSNTNGDKLIFYNL